ncbi:efflux RND transporter permease subunit [Leptospira andrefontaineae]|uniref:Efflux RND transporter permease subunit n=1 Tax=Leptospira andrefontaineae TaxID=2484976 RepID=A0A4R9H722_9LEPT|nr:efflux RND transporter permease subunit [Leptospira andrefontaineae]TGK41265.1 efflux RND transporter permease subunit [Leptospira andrefontaineae]
MILEQLQKNLRETLGNRSGAHAALLIFFLILSIVSIIDIPMEVFPSRESARMSITTTFPGTDVEKIEREITSSIEESLSSIGGILEMRSISEASKSVIKLQFETYSQIIERTSDIREKLEILGAKFPKEVRKPILEYSDSSENPVLILTINKENVSNNDLRFIAESQIKTKIEAISGIGRVSIVGGDSKEILIACDRDRLESEGLSIADVSRIIRSNNTNAIVSKAQIGNKEFNVYIKAKKKLPSDFASIPLRDNGNAILTLGEVAKISFSNKEKESYFRRNGKEGVSIYVYRTAGNGLTSLNSEIEKIRESLENEVDITVVYDKYSLAIFDLGKYFLSVVVVFLIFSVLVFRKRSVSNIVVLFYSFFCSAAFTGIIFGSINALHAIGINCVCIYFISMDRLNSFFPKKGLGEVLFSAAWIFAIYFLLKKDVSAFYFQALTSGAIFSIFYILSSTLSFEKFSILKELRLIDDRLFLLSERIKDKLPTFENFKARLIKSNAFTQNFIKRSEKTEIGKRFLSYYAVIGSEKIVFTFSIIFLFYFLSASFRSYADPSNTRAVIGSLELPPGSSVLLTNRISEKVEEILGEMKITEDLISKVEGDHSRIILKMKSGISVDESLFNSLKSKIGKQSPAFIFFSSDTENAADEGITFEVFGSNYEELDAIVKSITKEISSFPETEEVVLRYKGPRDEYTMNVDPQKAARSVLDASKLGEDIRFTLQGGIAAKSFSNFTEIDVRVRSSDEFRGSKDSLEKVNVRNSEGRFVPVSEISSGKDDKTPVKIFHKNRRRTLSFSVHLRSNSIGDIRKFESKINSFDLPEGYRIERLVPVNRSNFGRNLKVDLPFILSVLFLIVKGAVLTANSKDRMRNISIRIFGLVFLGFCIRILLGDWKIHSSLYFLLLSLLI